MSDSKKWRTTTGLLLALTLTGCASLEPYRDAAVSKAEDVYDAGWTQAFNFMCKNASIGSYQRLPGEMQRLVSALCAEYNRSWVAPGGQTRGEQ